MATAHKSHPRTEHINVGFHHFRSLFVNSGAVSDTTQQRADTIMTKSVNACYLVYCYSAIACLSREPFSFAGQVSMTRRSLSLSTVSIPD
jgi:hypothetical protein